MDALTVQGHVFDGTSDTAWLCRAARRAGTSAWSCAAGQFGCSEQQACVAQDQQSTPNAMSNAPACHQVLVLLCLLNTAAVNNDEACFCRR